MVVMKPLPPSWLNELNTLLSDLAAGPQARVAVMGIGHELRGDDAAGVEAAHGLGATLAGVARALPLNAGPAPENMTGALRRFRPDLVLLIDAAQMHEAPGTVRLLPWQETTGLSASSHTLPPYILSRYLVSELHCQVALLGIQPADDALGEPLTPAMRQAVDEVVQGLTEALGNDRR